MHRESISHTLQRHDAVIDVPLSGLVTLEPADSRHAIRANLLRGEHCFILMGTTARSAIAMAKIAAIHANNLDTVQGKPTRISTNVDYMVSVRRVLGAYLKQPDRFQAPVAWLISGDPSSVSCNLIRHGITTALQHLRIGLHVGPDLGYHTSSQPTPVLDHGSTVIVVRHPMVISELYVDERLAYPKACSGALASVRQSLGV
jgi:hypothetical protein